MMKIKTFFSVLICLFAFTANTSAQNCNSNKGYTVYSNDGNFSMSENDNNDTYRMTMRFDRDKTREIERYLIQELGSSYTTHTASLKRWTKIKTNKPITGLKVSLSKGYFQINYTGEDEDINEEMKALAREVKSMVKEKA